MRSEGGPWLHPSEPRRTRRGFAPQLLCQAEAKAACADLRCLCSPHSTRLYLKRGPQVTDLWVSPSACPWQSQAVRGTAGGRPSAVRRRWRPPVARGRSPPPKTQHATQVQGRVAGHSLPWQRSPRAKPKEAGSVAWQDRRHRRLADTSPVPLLPVPT